MLLGDPARGGRVRFIVALHRICRVDCLINRRECEESFSGRQMRGKACVLDHRRLSGRKKSGCAVAEPRTSGLDIDSLRDGELRSRALYVCAKIVGRGGNGRGIGELPATTAKQLFVRSVATVDLERDLISVAR